MVRKVLSMVIMLSVVLGVVGHGGYADQKYGSTEELSSAIIKMDQQIKNQEVQIKDLLAKTNDEEKTISAVKKNTQSLVKITTNTEVGSGFFVKSNLILTAYHVVRDNNSVNIIMYNGKSLSGDVVNYDVKHDIAMIQVEEPGIPVTINNDIHVGQTALSYGFPMGVNATVNKGIVSAINGDIQVSLAINNGDSGGMLLDSSGNVIGLITSRITSIANGNEKAAVYLVGYATGADDISIFMKRFK